MLIALWDDSARTLHLSNAGSVQPILVTRTSAPAQGSALTDALEATTIRIAGFPLGMFPQVTYDETAIPLAPGDLVVFFSDGITDAVNSRGEQFGEESLRMLLQHHPTAIKSAQSAVDAILEAVTTHRAGMEHFDDETIMVLRAR